MRTVADWVYRGNQWSVVDTGQTEPTVSGTYGVSMALPGGATTAQVLYDSDNYFAHVVGPVNPATTERYAIGSWGRPEGSDRGALIHGVEVRLAYNISGWAIGSRMDFGCRVIVADQNAMLGLAEIDTFYAMWQNIAGDATTEVSRYANGRQNCGELRRSHSFNNSANDIFEIRKFFRFKRRLQSQEALFLYMETSPTSSSIARLDMHCRTLVTDA